MDTTVSIPIDERMEVAVSGTTLAVFSAHAHLKLDFVAPAGRTIEQLDRLAAGVLQMRGRLLRELATDEDA